MIPHFSWAAHVSRCARVIAMLTTATVTGCVGPIGSPAAVSKQTSAPAVVPVVDTSTFGSDPSAPVSTMTINGVAVSAESIWQGHHAEVADKAQSLEPKAFQYYVKQRAAQLITDKITEVLLYENASEGINDAVEKQVNERVDEIIRRDIGSTHGGNRRAYERALKAVGDTPKTRRERLRREVIVRSYLDQRVRPRIAEPTRKELVEAFEVLTRKAQRAPRRRMSLIDIRAERASSSNIVRPEAMTVARARMLDAQEALSSGSSFADVARQHSDGLHAPDGGSWGWVALGSVREKFEPAVVSLFELDAGQVSQVIDAGDRFFLVRCDEIDSGATPDFQSIQPELIERRFRFAYNQAITTLVNDLREKARIEPENLEQFHSAVVQSAPMPAAVVGPVPDR